MLTPHDNFIIVIGKKNKIMAFRPYETPYYNLPVGYWEKAFALQHQRGGNFVGLRYQRGGFGLGGLIKGLLRTALPVLKSVGKTVGKKALSAGAEIAGDVLRGETLGDSLKSRGRSAVGDLLKQGSRKFRSSGPSSKAARGARRRKKKTTKGKRGKLYKGQIGGKRIGFMGRKTATSGKKQKRRRKNDIFGC